MLTDFDRPATAPCRVAVQPVRSVLLHVDATPASIARARFATRLARAHGASLTIMQATFVPQPGWRQMFTGAGARGERLGFTEPGDQATFDGAHWVGGDPLFSIDVFCHHAMYADLLVLGHATPAADMSLRGPQDFLATVLRHSGRPAFVLPATPWMELGRRILLGWDASRSAARAVAAAMPWLQAAQHLHVVDGSEVLGDEPADGTRTEIATFLHRHGIVPTVQRVAARRADSGERLLSRCRSLGADLLVMGCQGRSRAAEFVWGGATRTVLADGTLPLFMAH